MDFSGICPNCKEKYYKLHAFPCAKCGGVIDWNHEHDWNYSESETKAFCKVCGQASSQAFWEKVDSGEIEDRWRK